MRLDYTPDAVAVTPSDTTLYSLVGFYVGGTGDVTVVTEAGNTVVFKACPVGTQVSLRIAKIMAATTATLIVGFK